MRTIPMLLVTLLSIASCQRETPKETAPAPVNFTVHRVPVDDLPAIGDKTALVTVVAFTDYECPFCRRADATFARLRSEYGSDLRTSFAQHPLPMHPNARRAALAALASNEQGKYEQMNAALFASESLDEAGIVRAARDAGLDLAKLEADRPRMTTALERAEDLGRRFDVRGTPCFFINGRRVNGAQPYEEMKRVVDEELARARALVRSGLRPASVYETTIAHGVESAIDESNAEGTCRGKGCGDTEPSIGHMVETVRISGAPARGSGALTLVVFDDFECPFCARAEQTIHALENAHPNGIRVVFKNRPLPMHANARLAARAAMAADAQDRFWEYHDVLFAHQDALDRASLVRYAGDLHLDVARFTRDLDDPRTDARIAADEGEARDLGVKGTPTFFVNGHRVIGAQPLSTFEAAAAMGSSAL